MNVFPPMPDEFEPTRATLHTYAHAVSAIPSVHAPRHPRWWHISLNVGPLGLSTDPMPLPSGGSFEVRIDPRHHVVALETSAGFAHHLPMDAGLTGSQMGDAVIGAVESLGLTGEYDRSRFDSDEASTYDPDVAASYFEILSDVDQVFRRFRPSLTGELSPIQLWPHNFDLSFEWFGTRLVPGEDGGAAGNAQINLGFYVKDRPYFYSNPWPFEAGALTHHPLPGGAEWHLEGWEGSILYYDQVAGESDGVDRVLDYAAAVHDLAAPILTA